LDNRRAGSGRRVVRHKNKVSRANTNADSDAKTSETLGEEIDAQSIAHRVAEKENLADSVSESDTGSEVKTKKKVSDPPPEPVRIPLPDRHTRGSSDAESKRYTKSNRNSASGSDSVADRKNSSEKKRRARRHDFAR
jgi:hypothetical protein